MIGGTSVILSKADIPYLSHFAIDLNEHVRHEDKAPGIGRQKELEHMIQILMHFSKNTPMLLGEAGVGKTDLVEALAGHLNAGDVPPEINGSRIFSLNLGILNSNINGDGELGYFNENLSHIIDECSRYRKQVILFIDEFHTIMGASRQGNSGMDGSQLLKPPLARGDIRMIAATTYDEFRIYISKDRALQRRLDVIALDEPDQATTLQILKQNLPGYQKHYHGITISDDALKILIMLSVRYVTEQFLPDKAYDLLDASFSQAAFYGRDHVTSKDIQNAVFQKTKIPLSAIATSLQPTILNLSSELKRYVKGQDEAIDMIVKAVDMRFVGLNNPNRPLSFLFLGTTGVGKTEMAKSMARALFKDEHNMIRLDMAEFNTPDATERLLGQGEKLGILTEQVRRKPYSILLLDEIEKSSPRVWDLLLSIIDDGEIQDAHGRTVDFSNLIIVLTSNLAASIIRTRDAWEGGSQDISKEEQDYRYSLFLKRIDNALKQVFRPEFINRLANRIVFNVLKKEQVIEIAQKYLYVLIDRLNHQGYDLMFDYDALDYLTDLGTDVENGARPLQRVLDQKITGYLSQKLMETKSDPNSGIGNYRTFFISVKGRHPSKTDLFGSREFVFTADSEPLSVEMKQQRVDLFKPVNVKKMVRNHVDKPDITKEIERKIKSVTT